MPEPMLAGAHQILTGGRSHPPPHRGPWRRTWWIVLVAFLIGCSIPPAPGLAPARGTLPSAAKLDRVFVEVEPLDYARTLCRLEPMLERHSCMTAVVSHYRETRRHDLPAKAATEGPFVAFIDDALYRGRYVSNPFAAAFTVSEGSSVCRGRYNAFAGDDRPVFRLRCDDGREGRAQIVLDQTGSNGIGRVWMESGTSGDVVFGEAAVPPRFR